MRTRQEAYALWGMSFLAALAWVIFASHKFIREEPDFLGVMCVLSFVALSLGLMFSFFLIGSMPAEPSKVTKARLKEHEQAHKAALLWVSVSGDQTPMSDLAPDCQHDCKYRYNTADDVLELESGYDPIPTMMMDIGQQEVMAEIKSIEARKKAEKEQLRLEQKRLDKALSKSIYNTNHASYCGCSKCDWFVKNRKAW